MTDITVAIDAAAAEIFQRLTEVADVPTVVIIEIAKTVARVHAAKDVAVRGKFLAMAAKTMTVADKVVMLAMMLAATVIMDTTVVPGAATTHAVAGSGGSIKGQHSCCGCDGQGGGRLAIVAQVVVAVVTVVVKAVLAKAG